MIDYKQLMVGNYLQSRDKDGDGSIITVKSFDEGGVNPFVSQAGYEYEYLYEKTDYYDWFWVEPIELSKYRLEQLGFVWEDSFLMIDLCYAKMKLGFLGGANDKMSFFQKSIPGEGSKITRIDFGWNHPEYVHQLKNIFFTLSGGKELTIKEPINE